MTSSLVGSEMCIRDRPGAVPPRALAPPGPALQVLRRRHVPRQGRVAPVSYTHLTLPTICSV
eukprot:9857525-Prorocentrum_lima.AAC.1